MKKFVLIYLLVCWIFVIFMVMAWPMPYSYSEVDETGKIAYYDKGIHIVLFGILAYLIILTGFSFKKNYFIVALAGFFLSFGCIILTEYLQGSIPGRSPAYSDLFAGLAGTLMAVIGGYFIHHNPKKKLLLHVCCGPCSIHLIKTLKKEYKLILYFHNPNIFPKSEYDLRRREVKKLSKKFGVKLITGEYEHKRWKKEARGREKDEEGGKRCEICFKRRLEATAKLAKEKNISFFATTLIMGPQKNALLINEIGGKIAAEYGLNYLDQYFAKDIRFEKSSALAKKFNLYRQNYCGCEYSIKK